MHASRILIAKMIGGMHTIYFFWKTGKYTMSHPRIAPARHEYVFTH